MENLSLRVRVFLFFALIAAVIVGAFGAGLWVAVGRMSVDDAAPLVQFGGMAGFAAVLITVWVWVKFDENVARPIQMLARDLEAKAHADAGDTVDIEPAKYLGPIGPAVKAIAASLKAARADTDRRVAAAMAATDLEKSRLAAVLHEVGEAVVICTPDKRIALYNKAALRLLSTCGEVGLDRALADLIDIAPIDAAVEALRHDLADGVADGISVAVRLNTGGAPLRGRIGAVELPSGAVDAAEKRGFVLTIRLPEDDSLRAPIDITGRPEFYDFDLFAQPVRQALADRPLNGLTYVVFDSETTGLDPSGGDEIVQLAGVRVVNGRMLGGETFDMLANPGRSIPARSTEIHGITEAMAADAAPVPEVVRRFHRFAEGAVLVAHNAPFDMAFLRRHEAALGVAFDQPVLDTVLLSAHLFDQDVRHTLDALADRFGVVIPPEARHTALGDTLATAQVLLGMFDVLSARGVTTLGDALKVSERAVAIRRRQAKY